MRMGVSPPRAGGRLCVWVSLCAASALVLTAAPGAAQSFDLDWYTVDSGGGQSAGDGYMLTGSVGQPDPGERPAANGAFSLSGGFWLGMIGGGDGEIFSDGFQSGDLAAWSLTSGTKSAANQSAPPPAARAVRPHSGSRQGITRPPVHPPSGARGQPAADAPSGRRGL